jgi:hypothetical protein
MVTFLTKLLLIFTAIGCSPSGRSYTDTDKERLYIKITIQNKVHTINKVHTVHIQTNKVTQGYVIMFVRLTLWPN